MLQRTYDGAALGGVAANYYPHVFEAYIEDAGARLSVLGKQPHGVSSVASGELEVMLHRRTDFACCGNVAWDRVVVAFASGKGMDQVRERLWWPFAVGPQA